MVQSAIQFDQLTMFVAPVDEILELFGVKLASIGRNQRGALFMDAKTVPADIERQITAGFNVEQLFREWIDRRDA
ncbi:hypothetical protein VITU9109_19020 [Vibrio tubiashii ATCC 19109]|uniref:Uncharacterized protein n=1 Tax=Vibrio tubiashii ATCC 19109 TaxID=1051646 RepID=A0ABP2LRU3_9VIBR|nr:hypothetical protein VITU9109_19020 [Vibrio tubiashii ATCC 19109]